MRCLLDKNVARYAIAGLRYGERRLLSPLETVTLSFWRAAEESEISLFVSHVSYHVLQGLARYDEVRLFLDSVSVLSPTRYHARWTRRLRETTGLTREDAALVALASFGSNEEGSILGTDLLVTCDQRMINGYLTCLPTLTRRLHAMTAQLLPPFDQTTLPRVVTPDEILLEWAS